VTGAERLPGRMMSRKGEGTPPPEPKIRIRLKTDGRRVGATLPTKTYVAFKAHVARLGVTGEQVIVAAIERSLRDV
jgi:hypothetical protein